MRPLQNNGTHSGNRLEKEYTGKLEVKRVDVEAEGGMASEFGIFSIPHFCDYERRKRSGSKRRRHAKGNVKKLDKFASLDIIYIWLPD
ncbi:MAG: hypothetical protein KatS3mg101_0598 [Patescibacteria group bacterium]|nr:MAG: hypothetical protein KatS3mg101_0598 [Patescibacteria group bacterium]